MSDPPRLFRAWRPGSVGVFGRSAPGMAWSGPTRDAALFKALPAGLLLLATSTFVPMAAHAQAWLPEPGRGSIYIGYQNYRVHWTLLPVDIPGKPFGPYFAEGKRAAKGEHYGQFVSVDLDYGIRKGLALTVHAPYAASRYVGLHPPPDAPEISGPAQHGGTRGVDDGNYHGTLQDADIGLHQTVLSEPFTATPFVSLLIPLRRYHADGHAAAGKRLRALQVGAALARTLRPFLPDAYGQVTYTYAAFERALDHSIHQNRVVMDLGYFVTPKLSLKGAADWMRTSGGVEWYFGPGPAWIPDAELVKYTAGHDRLANERWLRLGGGGSYALTSRYVLYLYGFFTASGANTHAVRTLATGVGWNFATPWARQEPRRDPENR